MREEIIASLSERLLTAKDGRSHVHWLWAHLTKDGAEPAILIEQIYKLVVSKVVIGVIQGASMTSVAVSIGASIRLMVKEEPLEEETKAAVHLGVKVLEAFCVQGNPKGIDLLDIKLMNRGRNSGSKDNAVYALTCTNEENLEAIILSEDIEQSPEFPLLEPAMDWVTAFHPDLRVSMIRGASSRTLKRLTPCLLLEYTPH